MDFDKIRQMGYSKNNIKYTSKKIIGKPNDNIAIDEIIDDYGIFKEALIQSLICSNRDRYLAIPLTNSNYVLEFTPNFQMYKSSYYSILDDKSKPYAFNVSLVNLLNSQKTYLLEIHCFRDDEFTTWGIPPSTKPKKKPKINITYKFHETLEIISEKYFQLNKDDKKYLLDNFPEKLVTIQIINYFLTNAMINLYGETYGISEYTLEYFIDLDDFENKEIDSEDKIYINPLINKPENNNFYYTDNRIDKYPSLINNNFDNNFITNIRTQYIDLETGRAGDDHNYIFSMDAISSFVNHVNNEDDEDSQISFDDDEDQI